MLYSLFEVICCVYPKQQDSLGVGHCCGFTNIAVYIHVSFLHIGKHVEIGSNSTLNKLEHWFSIFSNRVPPDVFYCHDIRPCPSRINLLESTYDC